MVICKVFVKGRLVLVAANEDNLELAVAARLANLIVEVEQSRRKLPAGRAPRSAKVEGHKTSAQLVEVNAGRFAWLTYRVLQDFVAEQVAKDGADALRCGNGTGGRAPFGHEVSTVPNTPHSKVVVRTWGQVFLADSARFQAVGKQRPVALLRVGGHLHGVLGRAGDFVPRDGDRRWSGECHLRHYEFCVCHRRAVVSGEFWTRNTLLRWASGVLLLLLLRIGLCCDRIFLFRFQINVFVLSECGRLRLGLLLVRETARGPTNRWR